MKRGDVVLVDFPFASGGGSKVRPALVVQNDRNNALLQDTIVVPITWERNWATTRTATGTSFGWSTPMTARPHTSRVVEAARSVSPRCATAFRFWASSI